MTPAAVHLAQRLRADLAELDELAKSSPADADAIVCTLVSHLRSWRPENVAPLGTLPPPGETIRDPRGAS